jgi:hypothetical protein
LCECLLIRSRVLFESDLPPGRRWCFRQLPQFIEHDPKVFVVRGKLSDHSGELTIEYFDGLFAVQQFSTVDSMATVSCNLLI